MGRITLKYGKPTASPTAWAEYVSVIRPIYGHIDFEKEIVDKLELLRVRWRYRLSHLRDAGWESLRSSKFAWAWNCPPCCVNTTPQTQPCNLRICPFCHARAVAKLFMHTRKELNENSLFSYRVLHGQQAQTKDRIFLTMTEGLTEHFNDVVRRRHHPVGRVFRRRHLKKAVGGYYWHTFAPQMFGTVAADGSVGRWFSQHGCVAIVPPGWGMSEPLRKHAMLRKPKDVYNAAWLVARAFLYRPLWLSSPAEMMSQQLNAMKHDRSRTGFGCFRKRKS